MKQLFVFIACLLFISQGSGQRYIINDSVLIHTNYGITISATVVRTTNTPPKQPTALLFFIYANTQRSIDEAKSAADHGYVGIVADARGKRLGSGTIEPYEHEVQDVNAVIDWITQQPWSDGQVGMYGGSYSGFAQWAATKKLHKALKTIVPYVAAIPGLGLPMENNIFLTANYQWPFYVTTNKYLDTAINNDNRRFRNLRFNWFESGVPYNRIDSIDGLPNPWLQKWLLHPSYDKYWQSMVPFREEYANINIPVLTITGYYDDGQISAMEYFREHYKYRPDAAHYLIIGPYDHFGAQRGGTKVLRGYVVDSIALINTKEITFQWLDYILKGKNKPALIKDKINFQQMGTNTWKHASSLTTMEDSIVKFYLAENNKLSRTKPGKIKFQQQQIDLANRDQWTNQYYPDPIIEESIDTTSGLFFWTDAFKEDITISGQIEGVIKAIINKRDMDIGLTLYEVLPDGRFFHLSYYMGRASYANDMTRRQLLTPGKLATIPITRSRLFSKKIQQGSRLLVVLNINKNPFSEVNYGTGKIVNTESIKDAGTPLFIKWSNQSYLSLGISKLNK